MMLQNILLALLLVSAAATAFLVGQPIPDVSWSQNQRTAVFAADDETPPSNKKNGFFAGISNFFEELDAFVDDASARRLGAGAAFYGKRKSNFYGADDKMKKQDKNKYDPTEDYRVTAAGNYKWMEDEDGILRPVTRLKNKIMERK